MWSLLAALWSIPTPEIFNSIPYLNWCTIFMIPCLVFYISLKDIKVLLAVALMLGPILLSLFLVGDNPMLLKTALAIFIIAWIGQFVGHKIEGKKPSFFKDIQFLLIGPLWVFKSFIN